MKSNPGWPFGSAQSYGSPGAGGSLGYADPQTGIGYAYVTNRKSTHIEGDPRDIALRKALDTIVPVGANDDPRKPSHAFRA
jgi:CubicO group peptidase (beta-lactamase class C family)